MKPADQQAMIGDWCAWHAKPFSDYIEERPAPSVSPAFERGFAAGLELAWSQAKAQIDAQMTEIADLCGELTHEREAIAAQIEACADEEASSGLAGCLTVAGVLRELASKIRRGE